MPSSNLEPGQYQIGSKVFGRYTPIKVANFDEQAYNVAGQDQQASRTDRVTFGVDIFQPQPITLELVVLDNKRLLGMSGFTGVTLPESFDSEGSRNLDELAAEWRGDDVRQEWNNVKPLYCCGYDGVTRMVFGRPRKFHSSSKSLKSEGFSITAEYMRQDTLCYREEESSVEVIKGEAPTLLTRTEGSAPTWLRILGYGPLTHPVITIGEQQVELDIDIDEGEAFEVSSYPWRERAIDSNGRNINADMIGVTQYLDRLVLPANRAVPLRWTSDEINTWVPALGAQSWQETIDGANFLNLPSSFTHIAGKVVVRLDVFNPVSWFKRFLGSGIFGTTSAVLYNAKKYNTRNQYAEARIVEPFGGRSAIVIMSNTAMTNFVMLEVVSGLGNNWLRIRTGSAYNTYSSVRAEWQNTNLFGWLETDVVAIESDYDEISGDTTYTAYLNGDDKCTWTDSGNVVSTETTNRSQGFIFDLDGSLFTVGTGFSNLLAYDTDIVPAPTGQIFVCWHDAWSKIP